MLKIAHIVNPVKVESSHELFTAQPITFESMRVAKEQAEGQVSVQLYSAQYPEDSGIIPDYFKKLPDLDRSILDIRSFPKPRKYPLIADILNRLYLHSEAEYFIYTNIDIILHPEFYIKAAKWLVNGHDALIINRRRISSSFDKVSQLTEICRQEGKPHPGFDCFVFKRELMTKIQFGNICVGVPFIGVNFAHNLFCFAEKPILLDKEKLTFHIGMDIMPKRDKTYYWHNRNEFNRIRKAYLWDKFDIKKFPYANEPLPLRYIKWGLNPSLFVFMNFKLELRHWLKRFTPRGNA